MNCVYMPTLKVKEQLVICFLLHILFYIPKILMQLSHPSNTVHININILVALLVDGFKLDSNALVICNYTQLNKRQLKPNKLGNVCMV
jgi:hypothetical protein